MGISIKTGQIRDMSVTREKLVDNLLAGADLDLTGGAADATISGLRDAMNPTEPVTYAQFMAAFAGLTGGVILRDELDLTGGSIDLTGNATGNVYADANAGYSVGDLFCVTGGNGDLVVSDGMIPVNNGDKVYIKNDVAADADITLADLFIQDNTEAADILRDSDIANDLLSTATDGVLGADQGPVIASMIALNATNLQALIDSLICNEEPAITVGASAVTLANEAVTDSLKVYLNGQRIAPSAYTVAVVGGVTEITFTNPNHVPFITDDCVLVDYRIA